MKLWLGAFALLLFSMTVTSCVSSSPNRNSVCPFNWLVGHWQGKASWGQPVSLVVTENNGSLYAKETVFKNPDMKSISSVETFEIRSVKSKIELEVFPQGQQSLTLELADQQSNKVAFQNLKHDFPQVWSFELLNNHELKETASGSGKTIFINFSKVK